MKITKVEAIELRLPEPEIIDKASGAQNSLIVKIYTDEGIIGIGEVDNTTEYVSPQLVPTQEVGD
ncbi:unnamed protein product [marine sediment metagenome]|uniref:Mandelate racemase/muconate lactonizing enzyme N-terminal domain-containing protein n=1 Tax=marine sediment metagenome TaxID=412755 RepID=X1BC20_9ZZZZ